MLRCYHFSNVINIVVKEGSRVSLEVEDDVETPCLPDSAVT